MRSRRSTKSLALGLCIFCADALQAAEPEKLDTATDPRAPINARLAALQSSGKSDPAQRGKILPVLTELVLTDEQSAVRIGAIKALETLGWGEDSRTLGALVLARESGGEELRFRLKPGAASTRALTPAQMARKESFDRMWDFDSISKGKRRKR